MTGINFGRGTCPRMANRPNGALCGPPVPIVSMPRVLYAFWTATTSSARSCLAAKLNRSWFARVGLLLVRRLVGLTSWSRMQFLYCHHSLSIRGSRVIRLPGRIRITGYMSSRTSVGEDMSALSSNGLISNPAANHASLTFVGERLEPVAVLRMHGTTHCSLAETEGSG